MVLFGSTFSYPRIQTLSLIVRLSSQPACLSVNKWTNLSPLHDIYRVSKKTHLKEMCDFLTLKMLILALALIKTKNRHLFDPLIKKSPFSMEKCLYLVIKNFNFSCKMSIFWPMGQKDGDFFLINARANGNIFRVKKSNISLTDIFFDSPCKWASKTFI